MNEISSRERIVKAAPEEELVDLKDFVRLVARRKSWIAGICLLSTLLGLGARLVAPRTYQISAVIEAPISSVDNGVQSFDSVDNLQAEIESNAFEDKIFKALNLERRELKFFVNNPRGTRLLEIRLKDKMDRAEQDRLVLAKLIDELKADYEQFLADRRAKMDNQIKNISAQIVEKRSEIEMDRAHLQLVSDRVKEVLEDMKAARNSSMAQGRAAAANQDVPALLYISYFNQLQSELFSLRGTQEGAQRRIDEVKTGIEQAQNEIATLQMSKQGVQNIRVIQEPQISPFALGPSKMQVVIVSALAGIFLGLFFAVFFGNPER